MLHVLSSRTITAANWLLTGASVVMVATMVAHEVTSSNRDTHGQEQQAFLITAIVSLIGFLAIMARSLWEHATKEAQAIEEQAASNTAAAREVGTDKATIIMHGCDFGALLIWAFLRTDWLLAGMVAAWVWYCRVAYLANFVLYLLAKWAMHLYLLYRIHAIFASSAFACSDKFLRAFACFVSANFALALALWGAYYHFVCDACDALIGQQVVAADTAHEAAIEQSEQQAQPSVASLSPLLDVPELRSGSVSPEAQLRSSSLSLSPSLAAPVAEKADSDKSEKNQLDDSDSDFDLDADAISENESESESENDDDDDDDGNEDADGDECSDEEYEYEYVYEYEYEYEDEDEEESSEDDGDSEDKDKDKDKSEDEELGGSIGTTAMMVSPLGLLMASALQRDRIRMIAAKGKDACACCVEEGVSPAMELQRMVLTDEAGAVEVEVAVELDVEDDKEECCQVADEIVDRSRADIFDLSMGGKPSAESEDGRLAPCQLSRFKIKSI